MTRTILWLLLLVTSCSSTASRRSSGPLSPVDDGDAGASSGGAVATGGAETGGGPATSGSGGAATGGSSSGGVVGTGGTVIRDVNCDAVNDAAAPMCDHSGSHPYPFMCAIAPAGCIRGTTGGGGFCCASGCAAMNQPQYGYLCAGTPATPTTYVCDGDFSALSETPSGCTPLADWPQRACCS